MQGKNTPGGEPGLLWRRPGSVSFPPGPPPVSHWSPTYPTYPPPSTKAGSRCLQQQTIVDCIRKEAVGPQEQPTQIVVYPLIVYHACSLLGAFYLAKHALKCHEVVVNGQAGLIPRWWGMHATGTVDMEPGPFISPATHILSTEN
jgi:hypothetical protein